MTIQPGMTRGFLRFPGTGVMLATLVALAAGALPARATTEGAYGSPDPSLTAFSDYAFFRGEWAAHMQTIDAEGKATPIETPAYITGFYHSDGRTFQTCFEAENFHSTDVRAFDETAGEWRARFLNARSQRWNNLTSKKVGDTMETLVPGGYAGTADFDIKSVMHSITDERFINDIFRREKGSDIWRKTFEMTYIRQPDEPSGPRC